jgi:hypothetical protein
MTPEELAAGHVGFARAPEGWNWAAQERDGTWFWFRVRPLPNTQKGEWIAPARDTQFASESEPNPNWVDTLRRRNGTGV